MVCNTDTYIDGKDKKVLAIIGQDNWNLKKKRRYIKDKDGLVDILCFQDGCDHQFKFWDNVVAMLPKNSDSELGLGVHWGCKTIQCRKQE